MPEHIDDYELAVYQSLMHEQAILTARLATLTQLLSAHWGLTEGDRIAPDGLITRQVAATRGELGSGG